MKTTAKLREIREGSDADIKARIAHLEEELFGFRMKRYTNQLENTMKIRRSRREIALCKTVLSQRAGGVEQRASATTAQE